MKTSLSQKENKVFHKITFCVPGSCFHPKIIQQITQNAPKVILKPTENDVNKSLRKKHIFLIRKHPKREANMLQKSIKIHSWAHLEVPRVPQELPRPLRDPSKTPFSSLFRQILDNFSNKVFPCPCATIESWQPLFSGLDGVMISKLNDGFL